jgi:hypothetical protein
MGSFVGNNFEITNANKILDIINVFSLNNCVKLNRKLPSLLNSLKLAIETYMEQMDLNGISYDTEEDFHPNTKKYVDAVQNVYGDLEEEANEIQQNRLNNIRKEEKQKQDFLAPQPAVYQEKMLFNRQQQQFPSYVSTPQGGKTRKRSKNKKMRSNCHTKTKK